jgi:predicted RNA binding protein YcfA (HicA-like mRNA interferase family)
MTSRLPAVSGRDVIRVLERAGFTVVRIEGSHHRLVHPDDRTRATTVPAHGSKTLKRGTVRSILKQARFTIDEFRALLRG